MCLFCRFSMSAFARRGNYGGIKPDKKNRLRMNPIPILFITNVTIHILTQTMLYLETEYGKNGVKIQYFLGSLGLSLAFYPQFLPSFLQLSAFFSPHHSAALPSDAGRLKGSPRAAAARRSAARCINRPLN